MHPIILGTAGHIDHGKTSLIKALTGVDTDRLKEEKLRGITIELGFASLTLPNGQRLGIVDVPGHERFVRHMLAGATGMDLVALIIAADEGVMPQTREHLEICQLLKVKRGLVVLTKIDLVEEEWLELVEEDVRNFLSKTFLEGAPIIRFSAVSGQGTSELLQTLMALGAVVPPKPVSGIFRLPIDRVFTIKGFGTVVTGTAISGQLRVSDLVTIYPPQYKAKVRNIQVHDEYVEETLAGFRTAINLQGIDKFELERGMVVATPDSLRCSLRLDARLEILPSTPRPLKNRREVRLHTGASEQLATVILLSQEELAPGESGLVQFRLSKPLALKPFDRFVIREVSPVITVGGGHVIHINPPVHRRLQKDIIKKLELLESCPEAERIASHLEESAAAGLSRQELVQLLTLSAAELTPILEQLQKDGRIIAYDTENNRYALKTVVAALQSQAVQRLQKFHQTQPLKLGLSKEELRRRLPENLEVRLFNYLLVDLEQQKQVAVEKELVRLAGHQVVLAAEQEELANRLEVLYEKSGLTPPTLKEAGTAVQARGSQLNEIIKLLTGKGLLVKVKEDLFFHQSVIAALKTKLVHYLKEHQEISVPQFKDLTQTSRKFSIPLMEYFDAARVTVRVGENRRLR
ncbi:selenocysteine-specific translation elongation factor [Desulfobacca acetoxidans]